MTSEEHPQDQVSLRERMRHSASHVMADAVLQLFPEASLAIGPATGDGFYYDFQVSRPFTPEDLEAIAARMGDATARDLPFRREEISREAARSMFARQPFKLEIIDELPPDETISIYRHGDFVDLCRGPHVASTGRIGAYKLLSIAGAYWRGDEGRPMLQRIYGTAFETQKELDEYLARLEEAQRRDHRRLGRELDLFLFDPIAPASPFFLPRGAVVYNLMVDFMRRLYLKYGYQEVITPQIFSTELWKRSGHYENYLENMYFTTVEEREYGVKPMNCPGHIVMYESRLHSYRELPVRYADFGRLHRYERSGVTHGLTRVRSFSQDDAHIFCQEGQVAVEVASILEMLQETYDAFGLGKPRVTLSLRPGKRGGSEEMWDRAEEVLRSALMASQFPFQAVGGEGAFYGPKIDFFMQDALGREWQLGTVQLDLFMPERFDLKYVAEDGSTRRPVMVHRAVLGSLERFFGVLIEHYAGAFPAWLAPVQAVVIPIADRHMDYARLVEKRLRDRGMRVEVDGRSERMNLKIRQAQLQKVPFMLVVGDKEVAAGAVAVRQRSGQDLGSRPLEEALGLIGDAIESRA